jgi:hypothetical protein
MMATKIGLSRTPIYFSYVDMKDRYGLPPQKE